MSQPLSRWASHAVSFRLASVRRELIFMYAISNVYLCQCTSYLSGPSPDLTQHVSCAMVQTIPSLHCCGFSEGSAVVFMWRQTQLQLTVCDRCPFHLTVWQNQTEGPYVRSARLLRLRHTVAVWRGSTMTQICPKQRWSVGCHTVFQYNISRVRQIDQFCRLIRQLCWV